jgi:U3 small nucleolar RNA-associated protein 10
MLQVNKEISGIHLLIAPLFDLLKICLDEEEQVPLEYSKQLILSCLLSCCQKLPQGVYIYLL